MMRSSKKFSFLIFGFCFIFGLVTSANCEQLQDTGSTRRILQKADESRGNLQGVKWLVSITVGPEGKTTSEIAYHVQARGFETLATTTLPAKDKGNKVLMINGNMWFYKPGLSKPVPISRRQKLLGSAAYGDIASTNYDEDYTAEPLQDEIFENIECYVFDLRAKSSKATYDRIKYWISKQDFTGIAAEYYTVSGKKFKSSRMRYRNRVTVDGVQRPFISEIDIRDEILDSDHTILSFEKPRIGKIPNHVFNLNLLKR